MRTAAARSFGKQRKKRFLIDVKTKLSAIESVAVVFNMKAAVNSFLDFHEADVQILNKVKRRKVWKRKERGRTRRKLLDE
ncbi:MAG: hypothetical protein ACLP5V_13790 [Candidatus Bathyarchaeia archaeon]